MDATRSLPPDPDADAVPRALRERVKELTLLHETARLLSPSRPFGRDVLEELVASMPAAWQYPEVCVARISFEDLVVTSPRWRDAPWKQEATFGTETRSGLIEVGYVEERPGADEGPFLEEERSLIESVAQMLDAHVRHSQAEETRRRLDALLGQRQRMEAVGTFAEGIAHDFNNILAAISINVQLGLLEAEDGHPLKQSLQEIAEAGARAKDLVRQILTLGRHADVSLEPTDLRPVVEEALRMLRASLSPKIQLETRWDEALPLVRADATKIHQVVINLGINAAHAMADTGGRLRLALDRVTLHGDAATLSPDLRAGPYVRLAVDDTGPGMSDDALDHLFEPFFSTKGDRGVGLGLSVVHGIVRTHGGAIRVRSEVGKGTAFELFFPAAAKRASTTGRSAA